MRPCLALLIWLAPLAVAAQNTFFRHSQGHTDLYEVAGRFVVETDGAPAPNVAGFEVADVFRVPNHYLYEVDPSSDLCGRSVAMAVLDKAPGVVRVHPDYRTGPDEDDGQHSVFNQITVTFAQGTPGVQARALLEKYEAEVLEDARAVDPNVEETYRVRLRSSSPYRVLDAVNGLYDHPLVRSAWANATITLVQG